MYRIRYTIITAATALCLAIAPTGALAATSMDAQYGNPDAAAGAADTGAPVVMTADAGASQVSVGQTTVAGVELPFTGVELSAFMIGGGLLVLSGVALSRAGRRNTQTQERRVAAR